MVLMSLDIKLICCLVVFMKSVIKLSASSFLPELRRKLTDVSTYVATFFCLSSVTISVMPLTTVSADGSKPGSSAAGCASCFLACAFLTFFAFFVPMGCFPWKTPMTGLILIDFNFLGVAFA